MGSTAQYQYIGDKEVIGLFFQAYEAALNRSWVSSVASTFDSNTAIERYAGVGNAPALREWIGGRLAKTLSEQTLTLANKPYEATLVAYRSDLRRDKTKQLESKIAGLAERAAEHDEKLLSTLIDGAMAGSIATAYDGQFFFDTDHSVNASGTLDNDISVDISALAAGAHGSVTAPSPEEMALSISLGVQQLFTMKDDQGEPVNHNTSEVTVMVPVGLMSVAEIALTSSAFAAGVTNPIFGSKIRKNLVTNPRLTWTDEFAIFRTDSAQKPFMVQIEEAPVMEVIGEGSEFAFDNDAHKYGIRKRGNVGFWDFTKGVLVTMI